MHNSKKSLMRLYRVLSIKLRFWKPLRPLQNAIYTVIIEQNEHKKKPISTLNGKRGEFWKYMQVQKQFDDIEYWVHLQERLNHLALLHAQRAYGDLGRLWRPQSLNTFNFFKIWANLRLRQNNERLGNNILQIYNFMR